jgi:tryptophan 2,3-dioxygenase
MPGAPTYWDYLRLDRLLTLQSGFEETADALRPDEMLFVVVHQAYELWFSLILRGLREARDTLGAPRVAEETIPDVVHHLRRVNTICRLAVQQWEVVETMTPQGFLDFRDKLVPASGFQSFQLREIEMVMGLSQKQRIRYGGVDPLRHIDEAAHDNAGGSFARARIAAARNERTLLDALEDWLYRTPIQGSSPDDADDDATVDAFLNDYLGRMDATIDASLARLLSSLEVSNEAAVRSRFEDTRGAARRFLLASEEEDEAQRRRVKRIRAAALFIESYRALPLLAWPRVLLDTVVEMEQQSIVFRQRHARMVERMIGRRVGTGGSGGVDYLDETAKMRVFSDLWAIRTVLLRQDQVPPLAQAAFYGFRA